MGLSAGLSGCLFGKSEETFTYTTEVYGEMATIHERHADGSIYRLIGAGVEVRDGDDIFPEDGLLRLWPHSSLVTDPVNDTSGDDGLSLPFLALTRDSSYLLQVDPGILLPQLVSVRSFAGLPCRFSNPRAFQTHSDAADAIPLKSTGYHLSRTAEGARFAILIDSAASRSADPRADFQYPVTALIDVTCPVP